MGDRDEKSKLAICAASYCVLACGEILKSNPTNKAPRKKRRYWVDAFYKSRNK